MRSSPLPAERSPARRRDSVLATIFEGVLWIIAIALIGAATWMKADEMLFQHRYRNVAATAVASVASTDTASGVTYRQFGGEARGAEAVDGGPTPIGTPIGRLSIPRLEMSAVIAEGTTTAVLRHAVGRMVSTARIGEPGNIVLAGHRDSFFRPLEHIEQGDEILLQDGSSREFYRVQWTAIVDPWQVDIVRESDKPSLTLVTCYPFRYLGDAPLRFVVRAQREPASDEAPGT